jgi:two-component system sensor histidine kinase KdpD
MATISLLKNEKKRQYIISIGLILFVTGVCYPFSILMGYKVVALLLLLVVSVNAMFFDILPVLLAALFSALIWNFFFIPPKFTFAIRNTEDLLMFFMYFIVALVNATLTYRIRQMEKLANKREEKENTLKLYNTLLNSLSHELRTPISTIIGATDNLQIENQKLSPQNRRELLGEISKAALRLNIQVENLLNMSRLESGFVRAKIDWCDVNELIYNVINNVKENEKARNISVEIAENMPLCQLDYGLMEQVLCNLLRNAVLYVPATKEILINASFALNHLIIKVEDDGNGFPEKEISHVFDKFYRLKNSNTGGTGLGLSIAKGFVEAHNGTISLTNKASGGASFCISIPTQTSNLHNFTDE